MTAGSVLDSSCSTYSGSRGRCASLSVGVYYTVDECAEVSLYGAGAECRVAW